MIQNVLLKVGSYAYDDTKMTFIASLLSYDDSLRNTILDYTIKYLRVYMIGKLKI